MSKEPLDTPSARQLLHVCVCSGGTVYALLHPTRGAPGSAPGRDLADASGLRCVESDSMEGPKPPYQGELPAHPWLPAHPTGGPTLVSVCRQPRNSAARVPGMASVHEAMCTVSRGRECGRFPSCTSFRIYKSFMTNFCNQNNVN